MHRATIQLYRLRHSFRSLEAPLHTRRYVVRELYIESRVFKTNRNSKKVKIKRTSWTLNCASFVVGRDAIAHEIDDLQCELLTQILARTERMIVHNNHIRFLQKTKQHIIVTQNNTTYRMIHLRPVQRHKDASMREPMSEV